MPSKNNWLKGLKKIYVLIDCCIEKCGIATTWLILVLVLLVNYDVAMRYLLQSGSITLQELEWHLFSLLFLLGNSYALQHDDHVRLDLLYRSKYMNDTRRAWVDFIGSMVFLVPFCVLIISSSYHFVLQAWQFNEGSPDPGGLPCRWVLKAAVPFSFSLLLLQGLAEAIKNFCAVLEE